MTFHQSRFSKLNEPKKKKVKQANEECSENHAKHFIRQNAVAENDPHSFLLFILFSCLTRTDGRQIGEVFHLLFLLFNPLRFGIFCRCTSTKWNGNQKHFSKFHLSACQCVCVLNFMSIFHAWKIRFGKTKWSSLFIFDQMPHGSCKLAMKWIEIWQENDVCACVRINFDRIISINSFLIGNDHS